MKTWMKLAGPLALASMLAAAPAEAGWRLVEEGETRKVARSSMRVTAPVDWNRATERPTSRSEIWTQDGVALSELMFYAKIKDGETLFKKHQRKRNPLPEFSKDMLLTDLVEWYEDTANVALGGSLFEIVEVKPATLAGYEGVHFSYSYTGGDNVARLGEARAAIIDEKLYLISFEAPRIHYFDRYIAGVRAMMDSARFE
ncbi:hypothetical protein [Qipengyuania sphaerica]|uniref:hypothetical protein n=1 Tax=Qipengyuania sphaerica TaxID=2867243 RepID=UPI001C87CC19|nr:hypothetical protein [Qipengyuania sphaerica]MBX7539945.1 hypothetical protein [Qipengyuania sphaerica]